MVARVKLKIEKLGRIQRAELDVRPLTVLIGPNNTNKTWTAYVLYGLLQSLSRTLSAARFDVSPDEQDAADAETLERMRGLLHPLFDALKADPAPARVECSLSVASLFEKTDQRYVHNLKAKSICVLLGLPDDQLQGASARLELLRNEFVTSLVSLELVFERPLNRLQVRANRHWSPGGGKPEASSALVSYVDDAWTEQKILALVHTQLWELIKHVVVFPAERNGLLPVWPLLPASDDLEVPIPVADFGRFLGLAQAAAPMGTMSAPQARLSALLKKAVGGEIAYVTEGGRKRLMFRTAGAEIPLQAAASLSRAVAGLSIYIERFFQPDDVLIIDELEMNAHPQAQVALTEFVTALVNAGVRVVLTTHSPYVVDHLNNLMEASNTPAERREELARKFAMGTASSFISPDKVSVHAVQEQSPDGEVLVREVLNRETGLIDWSTFSGVSEVVTNLYGDILRASEEEA